MCHQRKHQRVAHVEQGFAQIGAKQGGIEVGAASVRGHEMVPPCLPEIHKAGIVQQGELHVILLERRPQIEHKEYRTNRQQQSPVCQVMPA